MARTEQILKAHKEGKKLPARMELDMPPLLRVMEHLIRDEWIDCSRGGTREFSVNRFTESIKFLRVCNICK